MLDPNSMPAGQAPLIHAVPPMQGGPMLDPNSIGPPASFGAAMPTEWTPLPQQAPFAQLRTFAEQSPGAPPVPSIPMDSGSTESGSNSNTPCWPQGSKRVNANFEVRTDGQLESALVAKSLAGELNVSSAPIPTQMDRDA